MKNGHHEILGSSHLHVQGRPAPKSALDYHMSSIRVCCCVCSLVGCSIVLQYIGVFGNTILS